MARYLVGIDLGTTNSALAFVDLRSKPKAGSVALQTFQVPQLIGPAQLGERQLLPSFLYLPGPHDLPAGSTALPWNADAAEVIGEFARNHGARIPGRLVSSAKSWLCHPGVDRTSPLLPWGAPPDVPRLSPLEVSARYLKHLVDSWNFVRGKDPADRLEEQEVVLTVPASFDDVARNLTAEAARMAGLKNVTLLEEPQAAFYCWMGMSTPSEVARMKPGMRCLVVDVGGGTSDFSLIRAGEDHGELTFVRDAVGDHLLLGGDNMDLALARYVETKLPQAGRMDAGQFGMLVQACREAKEMLLAPEPPDSFPITVMGRGRSIIGGSLHTTVTPEEVRRSIFEGFFPAAGRSDEPQRSARGGLQEIGLPYVSDPAITRHLAAFLARHMTEGGLTDNGPDAILFNGGVFQPETLRDRLIDVMRPWYGGRPDQHWNPLVLSNPSLDLAVSWGAAYYAWLRHSGGKRIGGGIPRSYYIEVEESAERGARSAEREETAPTSSAEGSDSSALRAPRSALRTVLCVVPRRLQEGEEVSLPKPELELALGQPVLFPLYTSTVRGEDRPGDVLAVSAEQLLQLPPLHTILRGGKRSGTKRVPVTLAARCTEIGTLELYCVAKAGDNRWRLEFNVRDVVREAPASESEEEGTQGLTDVWPEAQVQAAGELIRRTFAEKGENALPPAELTKALEAALEAPRNDWPTGLCRRLWDFLAECADQRTRSGAHLSRWYHLVGFCLRPGFGDPLDRYRVDQLWKMLATPSRSAGGVAPEGGADYWIMWRRVSGGLNAALQQTLFTRLKPVLLPGKGKGGAKPGANELVEMWRAGASLERLDTKTKQALGDAVLKQIKRSPVPPYAFWALTRLGARAPFYGPLNSVIHPQVIEGWLDAILGFEPGHDSERSAFGFCLAQMARMTGQRAIDIDDSHRESVLTVLRSLPAPAAWRKMVEEVVEMEGAERSQMFGESLPIGLRLRGGSGG